MMRAQLKPIYPVIRRRYARYCFEEDIRIGVLKQAPSLMAPSFVAGRAIDLGEGGVGAYTTSDLLIGETVHLHIPLPAGEVRLPACIRYRHGSDYGFEFLALGAAEREHIREACKSLERIG